MASNDVKVEQQDVTINFRQKPYVPTKYVFEMDDRPDFEQTNLGVVRIRKYPAFAPGTWTGVGWPVQFDQSIETYVTEGSLYNTNEVREKTVYGTIIVSGNTEAQLPYPVVHSLEYYIDGVARDIRGNEIGVNISFDSLKNAIVTSRPCYAVVRYSYVTQYQILRYYPNVVQDIEMYYMPDPNDYGQLLGYIKVPYGEDALSPVIFQITPPDGIAAEFELYRVESEAVAKEDGLYEKPTGWPTNGQYEGRSSDALDPSESNVLISRTHEIGYFSLLNAPAKAEGLQSQSSASTIPLDFTKELKNESYAGQKVAFGASTSVSDGTATYARAIERTQHVQKKEYFDKYRRILNNPPKMRIALYQVDIGKPFSDATELLAATESTYFVDTTTIVNPQGGVNKALVIQEHVKQYRIKLVVKASKRPTIGAELYRNRENANDRSYSTQVARINTMLGLVWEGVDWGHIRRRIAAAYDPNIYQVIFDSSFPTN